MVGVVLGVYFWKLREVALDDAFPHALPGGAFSSELAFLSGVIMLGCMAAGAQTPFLGELILRTPMVGFMTGSVVVAILEAWAILYLVWTAKFVPWPPLPKARRWVAAGAGAVWLLLLAIWFIARAMDDSSPRAGYGTASRRALAPAPSHMAPGPAPCRALAHDDQRTS